MQQSESINELAGALSEFQGKCPTITFNSEVSYDTKSGGKKAFKYADLAQLWTAIRPLLKEFALSVIQGVDKDDHGESVIVTQLCHKSGQWVRTQTICNSHGTPQDQGSYITYMKRYSLAAVLGLVAEGEDDDGGKAKEAHDKAVLPQVKKETDPNAPATSTNGMSFVAYMGQVGKMQTRDELKALFDKFTAGKLTVTQKTAAENAYAKKLVEFDKIDAVKAIDKVFQGGK